MPDDVVHDPFYVSPQEAARLLGLSRSYLYELLDAGKIESRREGTRRLVSFESVRAYADLDSVTR